MPKLDPHSVTDLDQGRIIAFHLDLNVDFDQRRLHGAVELELAEPGTGPLELDTRHLTIDAVRDADGNDLPFTLGDEDPIIGTPLRIERPAATARLRIEYATAPTASALQWLEPSQTAGKKHPYLFSQCQAIHARSMVPIQDSALVRPTYTAAITVPAALTAVMGAAPGEVDASAGGETRTFRFEMPQPIPAYLLALAVGNLEARDLGPQSRVYTEPEMLEASAWEFAEVDRMLEAAEALFGPYRWDRFDFLVMPPSFPYGGMENPRLTFLTPTLLAGDRSLVNVLAHELAHAWTGNLVTNANVNHFWLNEGFTVWAERRILEGLEGTEAMSMAAAIGRQGLDREVERFGADSPLLRLETDLAGVDPDEAYSQVPYEKGALFVFLLEQTVGREKWDAFVRRYMEDFAFTSITTQELLDYLEKSLPGIAEQVQAEAWIHGSTIPDNAPRFGSDRLERLEGLARAWGEGTRPPEDQPQAFSAEDWQVFFGALPKTLPVEECAWLDESFGLNQSHNAEILAGWLALAVRSGYEPAYARTAAFLGEAGRMKFLKPLYEALNDNEATRALAAETFAANANSYHPIAAAGIERLLAPGDHT